MHSDLDLIHPNHMPITPLGQASSKRESAPKKATPQCSTFASAARPSHLNAHHSNSSLSFGAHPSFKKSGDEEATTTSSSRHRSRSVQTEPTPNLMRERFPDGASS
eukprot:scaffold8055_cov239-Pinguiococcus_pyrenoidosus.AAC.3